MTGGQLRAEVAELVSALELWETRDDSKAQPEVRLAGGAAVAVIDRLTRELYATRARLVDEISASDDAAIARVDWLLQRREDNGGG